MLRGLPPYIDNEIVDGLGFELPQFRRSAVHFAGNWMGLNNLENNPCLTLPTKHGRKPLSGFVLVASPCLDVDLPEASIPVMVKHPKHVMRSAHVKRFVAKAVGK